MGRYPRLVLLWSSKELQLANCLIGDSPRAGSEEEASLRQTGGREEKHLAFVDQVGVAEVLISMGDASPSGAAMQLCLSNGPERVAVANGVLCGGPRSDRRRHNDF